MDTRREFLKKACLLAGGAGFWNSLPASIQKAFAINPDPGTTFEDAEHIVFLMQENRSFDHCFGTLQGVRGFNDPRAITIPGHDPVWLQTNGKGEKYLPFRLNIKDTKATWMGGLPHSWDNQVDARNDGKYNKWLEAKQPGNKEYSNMPLTMGYYTREDIPFYYALADAFTVCDQHFCSSLTGTTTNRTFFWTGKIRAGASDYAHVRNSDIYYNSEVAWKTFPERLEENGISWKVYQNEISVQTDLEGEDESWLSNFTDNNLEWFKQYNVRFHKAHYDFLQKRIGELPAEIQALESELKDAGKNAAGKIGKKLLQKRAQFEKYKLETEVWNPEKFDALSQREKNLHLNAFTTNSGDPDYHKTAPFTYNDDGEERTILLPKGDVFYQFRKDVSEGKLPTVSWLVAPQYFSDHPSAPWFGAWYVSEVLEILTKNPDLWKKTIFILNYDENDGYFDHVPPFVAPKPNDLSSGNVSVGIDTSEEYVTMKEELQRKDLRSDELRESPVGLGYRVPLIVASPWSRGGWVNSQVFDITSTLQFLEKFISKKAGKPIKETNISDWRRTVSGDLTSVFRPYNGENIELPKFIDRDPFVREIYNAKFKKTPTDFKALSKQQIAEVRKLGSFCNLLPSQENGVRNSCALPYTLAAHGSLKNDNKNFKIVLSASNEVFGDRSAGSPFNVYAPGKYMHDENGKKYFEEVKAWSYAVKAGDQLQATWPLDHFENERYLLHVYGPNGFFREFAGNKNDPAIAVELQLEMDRPTKKPTDILSLLLHNNGNQRHIVNITDGYQKETHSIALAPGEQKTMQFSLKNSFGWYNFFVNTSKNDLFHQVYAGRIETGNHSKSDPIMGRDFVPVL